MEPCSSRFTAAEGGTRLAASASTKNLLVSEYTGFISTRLICEEAYNIRGLLSNGHRRSIYITRKSRVALVTYDLKIMTDLQVIGATEPGQVLNWSQEMEVKEVLVGTSEVIKHILEAEVLKMTDINVMIIDSSHLICIDDNLKYVMKLYKDCPEPQKPRILALTYPLFTSPKKKPVEVVQKDTEVENEAEYEHNADTDSIEVEETRTEVVKKEEVTQKLVEEKQKEEFGANENLDDYEMYEKLEWNICQLEDALCCQMDLAEDIDGGKRISTSVTKPRELIIEYTSSPCEDALTEEYVELEKYMRDTVNEALEFLNDHRHDPTEIYGDELYDEFKNIPDPTTDPKNILKQFLYVLDQLGPYGADKAAFSLLITLEKLKIKVPYERHFLLLCFCMSTFIKIRCYADHVFSKYDKEWDKIKTFSTPKVLRFGEILEKFHPNVDRNKDTNPTSRLLSEIEGCDFTKLGDAIEDKVNTLEGNLKEIHEYYTDKQQNGVIMPKLANEEADKTHDKQNGEHQDHAHKVGFSRRTGRMRGRRVQRTNAARMQMTLLNPDALCGIVFVKEPLMAKILFMLIVDMSRSHPKLSYLCVQYCAVEQSSDPMEPKECQRQGKKQEDVLKKFRMHECNLLLATPALEEGIDLPRCNLVLRWDAPPSYRSYLLCRGRARASRSAAAVLSSEGGGQTDMLLKNVAIYRELDQIITRKCGCGIQNEPPQAEEDHADTLNYIIKPYIPMSLKENETERVNPIKNTSAEIKYNNTSKDLKTNLKTDGNSQDSKNSDASEVTDVRTEGLKNENLVCNKCAGVKQCASAECVCANGSDAVRTDVRYEVKSEADVIASVDLNTAIALINRYCGKLPSDTFTRLAPQWWMEEVLLPDESGSNRPAYICTLRLPLNCPVKYNIVGHPMPTVVLAKRMAALQACRILHKSGELDDNLMPIGKENFKAAELETSSNTDEEANDSARPGTTKRRQYYYKRTAWAFTDCQPVIDTSDSEIDPPENAGKQEAFSTVKSETNNTENLEKSSIEKPETATKEIPEITSTEKAKASSTVKLKTDNTEIPVKTSTEKPESNSTDISKAFNTVKSETINTENLETTSTEKPVTTSKDKANASSTVESETTNTQKQEATTTEMPDISGAEISKVNSTVKSEISNTENLGKTRTETTEKATKEKIENTSIDKANASSTVESETTNIDKSEATSIDKEEANQTEKSEATNTENQEKQGGKRNMLYALVCRLCCALPERYNTRGRRLHAPQHAAQALGILMARDKPTSLQIPAFPVYTRSGEVRVSVEHVPDADVRVSPRRGRLVRRFMRFVFSSVLRVRRRGMRLHSDGSTHNNYYIVPTIKTTRPDGTTKLDIDWAFLEVIYRHTEEKKQSELGRIMLWQQENADEGIEEDKAKTKEEVKKQNMNNPLLKPGETFVFDAEKYREAVVTPWYRNQDQPQFFLVAEICWNLSPDSAFPSALHTSFRNYYQRKYGVKLTQTDQPLLDVDHTSARLNLLTPRYVNRKGVALPVSSERTRRAKRDRLDQKQILVPELCEVHPFAAPLWFATVALPCVLYRINALLIADEIRRAVAIDVGLGMPKIDEETMPGFQWPPLDFGWSLAEVLSADSEKTEKKKLEESREQEKTEEEKEGDLEMVEGDVIEEVAEEKTINDILHEKEKAESEFEIGTWSNEMASSIPQPMEYDELMEPLPPNLTFCTSASGGADWCMPVDKPKSLYQPSRRYSVANSDSSYMTSDFDTEDSDTDPDGSDDETDSSSGFCSSKHSNAAMGVRIEYKTAHEAEAVDLERRVKVNPAPEPDEEDDASDRALHAEFIRAGTAPPEHIDKFRTSVSIHAQEITNSGLIKHHEAITDILPELVHPKPSPSMVFDESKVDTLFPYTREKLVFVNGQVTIESVEKNKRVLLEKLKKHMAGDVKALNCFSMKDVDIDSPSYVNEKIANVGFAESKCQKSTGADLVPYYLDGGGKSKEFDFDYQPVLEGHPGPSPSVILQALTMSNANDGINLERLETIGDSFLKFAITAYLYCAHPNVHEGKLSHMRSKQVSNLNLYRLGRNKRLGARMIASKFEPHDNWLPPCHKPPPTLHPKATAECQEQGPKAESSVDSSGCYIPYNLITQHSIPDKSIADCVEALIGAYLLECGPRGALLFMSWLGIRVLPLHMMPLPPEKVPPEDYRIPEQKPSPVPSPKRQRGSSTSTECSSDDEEPARECLEGERCEEWWWRDRIVGSLAPRQDQNGQWIQPVYGELKAPPSPLLRYIEDPEGELEQMLSGYDALERTLQYRFQDRSLLLQALTHASHHKNRLTDCYQRLEFLGDAILDYLITRHLYEDARRHCPGALTDLRSALVNNTIFATLAAKHGFHKYFRHMSPGLNEVLTKYVKIQEENGHSISEEHYLIQEDEMEQAEDVEVPKALGDLFESVAGAIFLDSGMSLGAVWRSYVRLMGRELEAFSAAAPKSPVRELLEAEPDTAKFGKPERLADGRRVRVCVEVFGRGAFKGVGRNYRIAKGTAARCALRHLRTHRQR